MHYRLPLYHGEPKMQALFSGKEVRLVLDGAAQYPEVFLNGVQVPPEWEAHCGYTAQSFLLSGLKYGEENRLSVRLDTRETLNQPPFGYMIDYLCYGGLYQEFTESSRRYQ